MKIQFTPQFRLSNSVLRTENSNKNVNTVENRAYNPIAYRDYDITFGARLFRTPENFYEQDFNEKYMPKMMHEYIYEGFDTAFRRTIPPAQAMKEVYGSLKFAQNLDMVKQIYPNEPLFADLHSAPSKKAREGVLGELALMRTDVEYQDKSLFKNGKDDLGLYILKKIYVEGKTLKEINKDFHRDTSVVYEGLGDIKYSDLKAFGIHFPERSFWKSFIATREDFPYVYIPRKAEDVQREVKEIERKTHTKISSPKPQRKKFDNVKDWEIDKITKAIEDTNGGIEDIKRKIRKSGNSESNSFVSQYMGEIMSVTLERLHASPEMKSFFEDYENLSVSQRSKLKKYWTVPNTRQNMSIVMKSTIKMFMEAYDEDGQNEEFQDLLEYAHRIKPAREEYEQKHKEMQEYYEDVFKYYVSQIPEDEMPAIEPIKKEEPMTTDKIREIAHKQGAEVKEFTLPDGSNIIITYNRKELCEDMIEENYGVFPQAFKNRMASHLYNYKGATDDYILAISLETNGIEKFIPQGNYGWLDKETCEYIRKQLFDPDKIDTVAREIGKDFETKNRKLITDSRQAMMELAYKIPFDSDEYMAKFLNACTEKVTKEESDPKIIKEKISRLYVTANVAAKMLKSSQVGRLGMSDINKYFKDLGIRNLPIEYREFLDERFEHYRNPLTNKEIKLINNVFPSLIYNFDSSNSIFLKGDKKIAAVWDLAMEHVRKYPEIRKEFSKRIRESLIFPENTFLRSYLEDTVDQRVKDANTEQLVTTIYETQTEFIKIVASYDRGLIEKYASAMGPEIYNSLSRANLYSKLLFDSLNK